MTHCPVARRVDSKALSAIQQGDHNFLFHTVSLITSHVVAQASACFF